MTRRGAGWSALFGDGPVVVDGGLSTQLEHQGNDISGALWTGRVLLDDPDAITTAHAAYAAAGADVVITASYQLSRQGFAEAGLRAADADVALQASVDAARRAVEPVSRPIRVAASVGPYGAVLHDGSEYRGRYGLTTEQLAKFHRDRIDVLVAAQPDLFAVETIPDADEARALATVLADYPDVPAWFTFSAADGERVCAGQTIEDAVSIAASIPSVVAVGVNCTDPRFVAELIDRMSATTDLPIVVYPNAGGRWDASDGQWHDVNGGPAFGDDAIRSWRAAGASAIGSCCGTDAVTTARIAEVLAASPQ